ncbi:MAG: DNA polymerase III subunit chi, partial [Octadecabacter sp.]|nr:DNA polymerase III subunit chi [Octadecabacter sp.]
MGAAFFYHLTHSTLEQTLPTLLAKSRAAGWVIEVRGADAAAMERLDAALWQGPADGFLPHGLAGGAHDADQPILLTVGQPAVNGATALLSVHGADVTVDEVQGME